MGYGVFSVAWRSRDSLHGTQGMRSVDVKSVVDWKPKIGIICYDLQPFAEDCIWRISQAMSRQSLTAYPVMFHKYQSRSRISYLPSRQVGRYLGLDSGTSTPEGLASNLNFAAAWQCVQNSDIVVLFGLQGLTAMLAAIMGRLRGRILVTVNQTLPVRAEQRRRWWIRWSKQLILRSCHINICQTELTGKVLTKVYGVNPGTLYSAPFEAGASLFKGKVVGGLRFRKKTRSQLGITSGTTAFFFCGNLHPFKGLPDLIRAIGLLGRSTDCMLCVAGREDPRGGTRGTAKSHRLLAESLGVGEKVVFCGELGERDLARVYGACDAVVLPTRKDCFPKVLVEGALFGRPLITTTSCGAAGSLVKDRVNGFVIQPGDNQALARALRKLLSVRRRRQFGRASRNIVNALCNRDVETGGYVRALNAASMMIAR